jgi:hypothetical protein
VEEVTVKKKLALLDVDYAELEKRVLGVLPKLVNLPEFTKPPPLTPAEEAAKRLDGTYEEGTPLDRMGLQVGLTRLPGEEDDAYRQRIMLSTFPPSKIRKAR